MQKILVIEDNATNLYFSTYVLEANGYEVIQAVDGKEGIALAGEKKPDLILLDIQLPMMDGYAVAQKIQENASLVDIPIVAVTANAMMGDRDRILSVGCKGYIEKPLDPVTFIDEIKKYLPSDE